MIRYMIYVIILFIYYAYLSENIRTHVVSFFVVRIFKNNIYSFI